MWKVKEYSPLQFNAIIRARTVREADVIFDWLADNIEHGTYTYNGRDMLSGELSFEFETEVDRTMFLLRWA